MLGLCTPSFVVEEALRSSSLSLDVIRASMARAIQLVTRDYTNWVWMFHRVSAPGEDKSSYLHPIFGIYFRISPPSGSY